MGKRYNRIRVSLIKSFMTGRYLVIRCKSGAKCRNEQEAENEKAGYGRQAVL